MIERVGADPVEPAAENGSADGTRALELRQGRTLTLASEGDDELLEIRSPGGPVELRIRLTPQGPVMELDVVRLALRAAEAIDVECKEFNVTAERGVGLASDGDIELRGKADVRVDADGEVRVTGDTIYLN